MSEPEEPIVTLNDFLEEEEQLEADANAVLGDSDDKNCTYSKGYLNRQALYACATCSPTSPAGVCLACSYKCHNGHTLLELYTKRNFRCDCGNVKFPTTPCRLYPGKDPLNADNKYNHNFKGLYCTCSRPYPDDEDDVEDEMIQCVLCEDWFHGRHLGSPPPDNEEFEEMICLNCVQQHTFLHAYVVADKAVVVTKEDNSQKNGDLDVTSSTTKSESLSIMSQASASDPDAKENQEVEQSTSSGSPEENSCVYQELLARKITSPKGSLFMTSGWRAKLCQCSVCKARYNAEGVSFLLIEDDTVHAYEERGRQAQTRSETAEERVMEVLSQYDRFQQMEMINGFNDFRSNLSEYLRKFAENGKVVRAEDIQEFFQELNSKRQRTQPPQWSCK